MRVVFIHGAFVRDGTWWWNPVATQLAACGIDSDAVALPSCGETGTAPTGAGPGLLEDAAATTTVLDLGEPTIVVAHSYGGMVAAQAAKHPSVSHLVYISSFLPNPGDSIAALSTGADPVTVQPHPDGSISVIADDHAVFDNRFLHDVTDADLVRGAHQRLTAQSGAVFGAEVTAAAWQHIPSTYLVCADERHTDPELQRAHAARATRTIDLPTGHHPMLSRPDLVAAWIQEIANGT